MLQLPGIISRSWLVTALRPNRTTASFESETGPPYDKQHIQMGLRSGNTVLISFRSGVVPTYLAWLPERLARTYCSAALDKWAQIPYGEVHHLQR